METVEFEKKEHTQEAYTKSVALLKDLLTDKGFTASLEEVANYRRVWARDGSIAGLAGLLTGHGVLQKGFAKTIATLARHQDATGRIPSNVSQDETDVSYGMTVGRVDATLWFVIAVCQYALHTGNKDFFITHQQSVERALFYLECLEFNGRGLLYIPQGGDWADEYISHGYVLFDQVLYYLAQKGVSVLTGDERVLQRTETLRYLIHTNYFPQKEHAEDPYVYHDALFQEGLEHYRPPLPLASFSPGGVQYHTDIFASALILMTDIVDDETKEAIIHTVFAECGGSSLLPAFSPVITEGDHEWEHLIQNYRYTFRNEPHNYHNGGLWPLVHGFFLAGAGSYDEACVRKLVAFATMLARDTYLFPEYYHGETHEAKGTTSLGFSAAAFIIAYHAVINKEPVFTF